MLKAHELRALDRLAAECALMPTDEDRQMAMSEFFVPERLHWLLHAGFDQLRIARVPITPSASELEETPHSAHARVVRFARVGAVRQANTGAWYYVTFGAEPTFVRDPDDTGGKIALVPVQMPKRLSDMIFLPLSDLAVAARSPLPDSAIVLPPLWCSPEQHAHIELVDSTRDILRALQEQTTSLRALGWRQLEEVVAELLRARGLDVHVTNSTRDGGRDIIARGELVPGEPTILAVEVKNRGVVGTPDIHRAWAANRDFPLVMVATSGRFSAGVTQQKYRSDTYHRLLLKDGAGLSQWIAQYRRR